MARAPLTFRKQDVTRAVMATAAAGVKVSRVKITRDGAIEVFADGAPSTEQSQNEWDALK
ncbi:MAG: hypothetical protein WDM86_22310 [Rhizomicrobium sp.]